MMNVPITARLYTSAAGYADARGFRLRQTTLVPTSGSGPVTPALVPFNLQFARALSGTPLINLTNENGVSLTMQAVSVDGQAPAPVPGLLNRDVITYTAPGNTSSDLSLQATLSGYNAETVVHNANAAGSAVFSFGTAGDTRLSQDPDTGVISVTTLITDATNGSAVIVTSDPEFFVETPYAFDSNPSLTALAHPGSVSMILGTGTDGEQTIALNVDQKWLKDPGRVFPVRIAMPLATADGALRTQAVGTVSSCAPTQTALSVDMVVGNDGCEYRGLVFPTTEGLPPGAVVQSATLHLYASGSTDASTVLLYPNAPDPGGNDVAPASWDPPSWDDAPLVMTGTTGVAPTSMGDGWQQYDVTGLVQSWLQGTATNNGLTLEGSGTPVLFHTAQALGSDSSSMAPYLAIVYTMAPMATGAADQSEPTTDGAVAIWGGLRDGARSIYGVSEHVAADYAAPTPGVTTSPTPYPQPNAGQFDVPLNQVAGSRASQLGADYIRFNVTLECPSGAGSGVALPDSAWWGSSELHKDPANNLWPTQSNWGSVYDLLWSAQQHHIDPILNLTPGPCPELLTAARWVQEVGDLATHIKTYYSTNRPIYFEIGNEVDNPANRVSADPYPLVFAQVAKKLQDQLHQAGFQTYRIMTGGMARPTANMRQTRSRHGKEVSLGPCSYAPYGGVNIQLAQNAITQAKGNQVTDNHLAVAIHPYGYTFQRNKIHKPDRQYWRYYMQYAHNKPFYNDSFNPSICFDLEDTIQTWEHTFSDLPVFFTEDNAQEQNNFGTHPHLDPVKFDGAYLIDLFTYLHDRQGSQSPNGNRLRVLWFTGADFPGAHFGLYTRDGSDKQVSVPPIQSQNHFYRCAVGAVRGTQAFSDDFRNLRTKACY